ncbi:hypothetical protein [Mycobacterium sp. HUMS_1102779]|uniref:hypothetical protein n=1 Tax=Mycobacterium sp. HUMS_1102779 TaxID=3383487 RepID=UPI0038999C31
MYGAANRYPRRCTDPNAFDPQRPVHNARLVEDPPPYRTSQVFRGPRHLLVDYDEVRP